MVRVYGDNYRVCMKETCSSCLSEERTVYVMLEEWRDYDGDQRGIIITVMVEGF